MTKTKSVKYEELEQYDGIDTEIMENLSRKYAFLVGKFLLNFSYLEHSLDIEIAELINNRTHDQGYLVIKNLTYSQKVDLLSSLSKPMVFYSDKNKRKKKERLEYVNKNLKNIGKLRNNIAHANWFSLDEDGYVRVKIKPDTESGLVKFERVKISEDTIKNGIKDMEKLMKKLSGLWEDLYQF